MKDYIETKKTFFFFILLFFFLWRLNIPEKWKEDIKYCKASDWPKSDRRLDRSNSRTTVGVLEIPRKNYG